MSITKRITIDIVGIDDMDRDEILDAVSNEIDNYGAIVGVLALDASAVTITVEDVETT